VPRRIEKLLLIFLLYCSTPAMRNVGIGLLIAAYGWVLYTSLAAAYARAHTERGPAIPAEYSAPWPVALACALALNGLVLALIPVRRGERWAIWLSAVTLLILQATRIVTDPCCLLVLDPHQRGCHAFIISMVLGLVGLAVGCTWPFQSRSISTCRMMSRTVCNLSEWRLFFFWTVGIADRKRRYVPDAPQNQIESRPANETVAVAIHS